MSKFSIFFEEEYLGDGLQSDSRSFHYFCRKCGRIWARRVAHEPSQHCVLTCHCPEHDDANWGPAVLCEEIRFMTTRWPIQALVRDFLYLAEQKFGPFIPHNPPRIHHERTTT